MQGHFERAPGSTVVYRYDAMLMRQLNTETKGVRLMRRTLIDPEQRLAQAAQIAQIGEDRAANYNPAAAYKRKQASSYQSGRRTPQRSRSQKAAFRSDL